MYKQVIHQKCVPYVDVLRMKTDQTKKHLNVLNVDMRSWCAPKKMIVEIWD